MEKGGLTNSEGLRRLISCIEAEFEEENKRQEAILYEEFGGPRWLCKFCVEIMLGLRHSPRRKNFGLVLCWRLLLLAVLLAIALLIGACLGKKTNYGALAISLSLFLLILLNILLSTKLERWRRNETQRKTKQICDRLKLLQADENFDMHLKGAGIFIPSSECINLQWTYRNGTMLNLPWILLVEGDSILVRPGREAPAKCTDERGRSYSSGEIIPLSEESHSEGFVHPMKPVSCTVTEAPIVPYLRTCFRSAERPIGVLDNELYKCTHEFLEKYLVPFGIFIAFFTGIMRFLIYPEGSGPKLDMLLLVPAGIFLPLTGLMVPLINFLFSACNQVIIHSQTELLESHSDSFRKMFLNDEEEEKKFELSVWSQLQYFMAIVTGSPANLTYTANPVETLGSVTSVSVVDKKGILSWPNPTAEKIFFVRKDNATTPNPATGFPFRRESLFTGLSPDIMTLSNDPSLALTVSFDDPAWSQSLPNLKPLGLNMILNSCKLDQDYLRLVDHIHVVSKSVPRTIPVVNRRCCCHLAESIGFQQNAVDEQFEFIRSVAGYKKQPGEAACPGLTKHRTPFPTMFASIVRDKKTGQRHLMAQGTADLLLDLCSHCWVGGEICELPKSLRRKIADFYHRYSMTSYCLAFSYRPLAETEEIPDDEVFIDWPVRFATDEKLRKVASPSSTPCDVDPLSFSMDAINRACEEKPKVPFGNQIFLGMVTIQYPAKPDVVHLVELLDKACIRFVHFSKENELRSRGFAERMGLESGWNCHISLASEGSLNIAADKPSASSLESVYKADKARPKRLRRHSLPGGMKMFGRDEDDVSDATTQPREKLVSCGSDAPLAFPDELGEEFEPLEETPLVQSEEVGDEYLIENRAQLPKGIENVRPHLEKVDNVPLLVSLFTDCNHSCTREMIEIMQENGEVVLVLGSNLNADNADIFSQSNTSIAMTPLLPMGCTQYPVENRGKWNAMIVAGWIYSLPCSFSMSQINLLAILGHSRHCLSLTRSALVFYTFASFSLFAVQALALALLLPLPIDFPQLALFLLLLLPLLSGSILGSPPDLDAVLQETTSRNEKWLPGKKAVRYFGLGFLTKFLPSVLFSVLMFGGFLMYHCYWLPFSECRWYINMNRSLVEDIDWGGYEDEFKPTLVLAQNFVSLAILLSFCAVSATFVYPSYNFWSMVPLRNRTWIIVCILVILLQSVFSFTLLESYQSPAADFPVLLWVFMVAWTVPAVVFAELYKRKEIAVYRREQRRRRLSFGTKLGLNSPF